MHFDLFRVNLFFQILSFHFCFTLFNLIVSDIKWLFSLNFCLNISCRFPTDLLLSTGFQKLFEILGFHRSFILLHKLRARIWSRKKKQQNRKHCEENHTTTKNTREISGFCFFYQRVIFRLFFVDRLKRVFVWMFFFWEIDQRRRDWNVKTHSWKQTAVIALYGTGIWRTKKLRYRAKSEWSSKNTKN